MDRLSIFLTLMSGAFITGTLIIIAFTLGYYNWWAIGGAAIIGFATAWPSAYIVSRRIKRQDPNWDETRVDKVEGVVPDPSKKEV